MVGGVTEIHFLEFENNQWTKVKNILPPLKMSDFITNPKVLNKIEKHLTEKPPIEFILPRKGKNIHAVLTFIPDLEDKLSQNDINFEKIELIWNDGTFKVGKKFKQK
jgi:hypothetical protein